MIDPNKTYRTKNGRRVHIYAVYPEQEQVHGYMDDGNVYTMYAWYTNGQGFKFGNSPFDLVEVKPYEEIPIDTPCLFWDKDGEEPRKRYFAGVRAYDGKPTSWADGATSWSVRPGYDTIPWNYCEPVDKPVDRRNTMNKTSAPDPAVIVRRWQHRALKAAATRTGMTCRWKDGYIVGYDRKLKEWVTVYTPWY